MTEMEAKAQAKAFSELHRKGSPLVLVNIWDPWSAKVCAAAGYPALGTSSHSVAESLGYKDGQDIPLEALLAVVERIKKAVSLPLTVDFEAGFASTAAEVGETVAAVIEAGAIGINIEDGLAHGKRALQEAELHAARISAARTAALQLGIPLFINARFDGFLLEKLQTNDLLDEAIRRGKLYGAAGANGLFVPGLTNLDLIGRLVRSVELPVNIMMMEGGPSVPELAGVGVARVSLGPWPFEFVRRAFRRAVDEFAGNSAAFF